MPSDTQAAPAHDHDRLMREREFHNNRFSDETRLAQGKSYAAIKHGAKLFEDKVAELARGADILEYGCGNNAKAFALAPTCRTATGIDISDVAVQDAEATAARLGLGNLRFAAMNAEAMTFPDASFDLVYGRGIIHHLDLARSFAEVARVLRPGGTALFWEPLGHNLGLELYRRLTPSARTPDEHPLLRQDFDLARRFFGSVEVDFYGLSTLLSVPVRDTALGDGILKVTAALDRALFQIPGMRWQAWYCLMEMRAPRDPTAH